MDIVAPARILPARRHLLAGLLLASSSFACGDNLGWKPIDESDRDLGFVANPIGSISAAEDAGGPFPESGAGVWLVTHPTEPHAELVAREGDCEIWVRPGPFYCPSACNGNCVGPDECAPYPAPVSAGTVTISGLVEPLRFQPGDYGYREDSEIEGDDIFSPGAAIVASAAGDVAPGFTLEAAGVAPLEGEPDVVSLEYGEDEVIRWRAAGDGRIQVALQVGHHGRPVDGLLVCETADDGELVVPGDLIATFYDVRAYDELQHASWMARFTRDAVETEAGTIQLFVASQRQILFRRY